MPGPNVDDLISPQEIALVRKLIEQYRGTLSEELSRLEQGEALHLTKKNPGFEDLPRSVLVYQDVTGTLRYLIQLKSHTKEGRKEPIQSKTKRYVGNGSYRTVKYLLDPETNQFYAETINKKAKPEQSCELKSDSDPSDKLNLEAKQSAELDRLKTLNSPYVNSLVCFAKYINSKNEPVVVTVSPYQPRGPLSIRNLDEEEDTPKKIRYVLELLLGVKAMHDKGYTHKDIKSANILLTDKGVLLVDIDGVAINIGYEPPERYCYAPIPKKLESVAQYVAQDIFETRKSYLSFSNSPVSRWDIWSLGLIAYKINKGDILSGSDAISELAKRILNKEKDTSTSILTQFALFLLEPNNVKRPDINQALRKLFLLLIQKQIEDSDALIKAANQIQTEADHLALIRLLFPHHHDLFLQLPLELQKAVITNYGISESVFADTQFYKQFMNKSASQVATEQIIARLHRGIEDPIKYKGDLLNLIDDLDNSPDTERATILKALNDYFSNEISDLKRTQILHILKRCKWIHDTLMPRRSLSDEDFAVCIPEEKPGFEIPYYQKLQRSKLLQGDEHAHFITKFKACSEQRVPLSHLQKLIQLTSAHTNLLAIMFLAQFTQPFEQAFSENILSVWVKELARSQSENSELPEFPKSPTPWTASQKSIFILMDWVKKDTHYNLEKKLRITEQLYAYIQKNSALLFPPRHPIIDSLGTWLGRGEKIIKRQQIMMITLKHAAFNYLHQLNDLEITQSYTTHSLFTIHRSRGWFNSCRKTSHQKQVEQLLAQQTLEEPPSPHSYHTKNHSLPLNPQGEGKSDSLSLSAMP